MQGCSSRLACMLPQIVSQATCTQLLCTQHCERGLFLTRIAEIRPVHAACALKAAVWATLQQ
jgi:hypothetical protein